jgi:ABC-type glycerol-3-phosphate transport system substrate-binding protein
MRRWLSLLGFAMGLLLAAAPPACSASDKSLNPDEIVDEDAMADEDAAAGDEAAEEPGITVEVTAEADAAAD